MFSVGNMCQKNELTYVEYIQRIRPLSGLFTYIMPK